ncbi:Polymerase epsilon subunit [hydrothermal vent metagenome]|uniref:Polymerase epsilon subunit n=1 Tax=hydrothermal vent metagenome TaxID=652676 RepID=A0A3B0VUX0_9ZZZZ
MTESNSLALCAEQLNQSDDYQVLQKLSPNTVFNQPTPENCHRICVIDTETTGLDTEVCEIIELGYQIIEFDSSGHFYKVLCAKNFLNEPEGDISAEVTRVTGLTLNEVKGHSIPWDEVEADIQSVQLCVAHNAGFDRPILERYSEVFISKIWGCSVAQIDWTTLTEVGSKNQEFLCWKVGQFFYAAHRALDDVQALCQLLSLPISDEQKPALSFLLHAVRQSKSLVKATGAPFDVKDELRSRGYRWNVGERVWQKLLDDALLKEELAWLIEHNTANPTIIKLKATDSFSIRAK